MKKSIIVVIALICCVVAAAAAVIVLTGDEKSDPFAGLKESGVKINEGTKWELNGKLTTRIDKPSDAVAIIVHGSGSIDMDLSIGPNKMYQDLAWGIAQNGVDTLRYDKRTFAHSAEISKYGTKITVEEETIEDAIAAAELMKSRGYSKIFLIGHSLGGMLAPIIVKESDGLFDGFVSLAGSPRTLPEISFDQNIMLLGTTPESLAYLKLTLGPELAKLDQLDSWTESELLSKTIMGYPAYYLKDMIHRDAKGAALSLDVPMLFLQGSADFQVYADKDFAMWKEILAGKEGVEFKLYEGLNHLFMVSQGKDAGTTAEYLQKGHVSQNVIQDIAEFIKAS